MDWEGIIAFSVNPLEIVLRGTLMYWFLFVIFRFILRREYITRTEVQAKMREQGIEELNKIKEMRLESDGTISVIRNG